MIYITLIAGLICLTIGIGASFSGTRFSMGLFLSGGVILTSASLFGIREARKAEKFKEQLWVHWREILGPGITLEGQRIQAKTQLTQFVLIVSFAVVSSKILTRFHPWSHRRPWSTAILFSIATAIAGWWSFEGIIFTPLAIYKNLRFAYTKTAGEVIGEMVEQRSPRHERPTDTGIGKLPPP